MQQPLNNGTLDLTFLSVDGDNCRVYYRSQGGALYCFQRDNKTDFNLYPCTEEGEPLHTVPIEWIKAIDEPPKDGSIGEQLDQFLAKYPYKPDKKTADQDLTIAQQRGAYGARVIKHFGDKYGHDESNLRDVLSDLMHWAEQNGVDFDKELSMATDNYGDEKAGSHE